MADKADLDDIGDALELLDEYITGIRETVVSVDDDGNKSIEDEDDRAYLERHENVASKARQAFDRLREASR